MAIFITVLLTIFIAEMGDKTQLLLVAMAGRYKVSHILTGTWLATILLNVMAVGVGAALSNYLDMRIIKTIAGLAFFWFAYATLKGEAEDEDEENVAKNKFGPVLAIFISFFVGELGDKTQLSAITLAANYTQGSFSNAFAVFLGCTLGLLLADLIGLIVGTILRSKMPVGILNTISFAIFTIFGVVSIREAMLLILGVGSYAVACYLAVTIIFAIVCLVTFIKKRLCSKEQ
ncbi:MAG: TMEM165/GDT1 family protein [Lachnospiraceae bacterium]|nr:TMEM165/GDT1 family protein [Lachnospiraceae bacterium]